MSPRPSSPARPSSPPRPSLPARPAPPARPSPPTRARRLPGRRHPPRLARHLPFLAAALALVAAAPRDAAAQRKFATIDSLRHIQSLEPRSGPPGTVVSIYTENLPPQARIHVGVGAMRAGFEALAEGTQDIWGEVSAKVQVPAYATWERPLVFIVFNGNFSPIGISDPFHVTNEDGLVRRAGRITDEGLDCVTLRDGDQYMYALAGDLGDLKPGDEVVVEGAVTVDGPCAGADRIEVVTLERSD